MQIGNFNIAVMDLTFEPIEKDYKFYGSYYRGLLGRSLKRRFCVLKDMECAQCPIKDKCLYMLSFERYKDVLFPPYIINRAQRDHLRITFVGSFTEFCEIYLDAFKRLNIIEGGFLNPLINLVQPVKMIVNSKQFGNLKPLTDELIVQIKFGRFKKNSRLVNCEEIDAGFILEVIERRIYLINKYYGDGGREKVYIGEFKGKWEKIYCKYERIYRYSHRQGRKMLIPAVSVGLKLKGDITGVYPFIYLASFLNIGTNPSMGFGTLEMTPIVSAHLSVSN